MIAQAERQAGPAAAEQLRQQQAELRRLTGCSRAARWRDAADLDRDERGDLLIHPENLPAVLVWLQVHDQWLLSPMGDIIGLNMGVALEFTRQLAMAAPDDVDVLGTTARVRVLAGEAKELITRNRRN